MPLVVAERFHNASVAQFLHRVHGSCAPHRNDSSSGALVPPLARATFSVVPPCRRAAFRPLTARRGAWVIRRIVARPLRKCICNYLVAQNDRADGECQLFTHLTDSIRAALAFRHVVIAATNVSGTQKMLCYLLPAIHKMLGKRQAKKLWGSFKRNAAVKSKTHGRGFLKQVALRVDGEDVEVKERKLDRMFGGDAKGESDGSTALDAKGEDAMDLDWDSPDAGKGCMLVVMTGQGDPGKQAVKRRAAEIQVSGVNMDYNPT